MPYHVQFPGFGWEFDINPIAFSIGDYKVYWYGIIIACGLLLAVLYAWKSAPRYKVDGSKLVNCVFAGMITGIIGARLYFCFFKWDYYGQNPIEILYINNGGLAIYGGIIGALLGGLTVAKIQKMEIMPVLDIAMVGFPYRTGNRQMGQFYESGGIRLSYGFALENDERGDRQHRSSSVFFSMNQCGVCSDLYFSISTENISRNIRDRFSLCTLCGTDLKEQLLKD